MLLGNLDRIDETFSRKDKKGKKILNCEEEGRDLTKVVRDEKCCAVLFMTFPLQRIRV